MPSSPISTPPVHAIFGSRLKAIETQLEQIQAWIRTNPGALPIYTEATKKAQRGQCVFVSDASSGKQVQCWTGTEWIALG
jgi:hypothetical protein